MAPRLLSFLLIAVTLAGGAAHAQEAPLSADRPGLGDGSAVVAPGVVQGEAGYAYQQVSDPVNAEDDLTTHALGQLLLRYGLAPRIELRAGLGSYLIDEVPASVATGPSEETVEGLSDLVVGAKLNLLAGDGLPRGRPNVTLLVSTTLPTGADAFGSDVAQPEAKLAADWSLTEQAAASVNVGYALLEGADDDRAGLTTLTVSLGTGTVSLPGLGVYVGYGGFFAEGGGEEHVLEGGATYLLSPDVQVDVNGGFGLNERDTDFFVGFGVAYRL